ncbi:MAG: NUDIX domain-containing protein [Propionibacterium sp.]
MSVDDLPHRTFVTVVPADRPVRRRRASRVIVLAGERVLLEEDTDPGCPGVTWWVTPGGGVDAGESFEQAAVRELREETGLHIAGTDLEGPVGRRVTHHGYSDQVLVQQEFFFILRTEQFTVDTSGYTPEERQTLARTAWLTRDELAGRTYWPELLPTLWNSTPGSFLEMGHVEESTVPLTADQRDF